MNHLISGWPMPVERTAELEALRLECQRLEAVAKFNRSQGLALAMIVVAMAAQIAREPDIDCIWVREQIAQKIEGLMVHIYDAGTG